MRAAGCSVVLDHRFGEGYGEASLASSVFQAFRPSLAPLYSDQHMPLPAMSAVSPDQLRGTSLSAELLVTRPLPLAAVPMGIKLLRVGHTPVRKLSDVPTACSSRRIWIQTAYPSRPERSLSEVSREVLNMWHDLCSCGDGMTTAFCAPCFVCDTYADACADAKSAGLGGYVRLPNARQLCFPQSMSPSDLAAHVAWFPADADPKHYIAAWELAAQLALLRVFTGAWPSPHSRHLSYRQQCFGICLLEGAVHG